jgi:hypothetical protein
MAFTICVKKRGHPLKGLSLQNDGGQAKRKNTPSFKKTYFLLIQLFKISANSLNLDKFCMIFEHNYNSLSSIPRFLFPFDV